MYPFWLGRVHTGIFSLSTSSEIAWGEEINFMLWLLKLFYKEGVTDFSLLLVHWAGRRVMGSNPCFLNWVCILTYVYLMQKPKLQLVLGFVAFTVPVWNLKKKIPNYKKASELQGDSNKD